MADIQKIADRIFHYVDRNMLRPVYAVVMGALIDAYAQNKLFYEWILKATSNQVEILIRKMVCEKTWRNDQWLTDYVLTHKE